MKRKYLARTALAAAVATMLAIPAASQAAPTTATVGLDWQGVATYQAAPGQHNNVHLASQLGSGGDADQDVISDSGVSAIADVDGPGGCSVLGTIARCPAHDIDELHINLGDMSDTLETHGFGNCPYTYPVTIEAGDGSDTIRTGDSCDTILAGPGNDRVYSGRGQDHVMGEAGNNQINGQEGDDVLVGGSDRDTIYGERREDIDPATEVDFYANDKILGGPGRDRLTGGYGSDTLFADYAMGDGTDGDRLYGGVDADFLYGGGGRDALYGEAGRDHLFGFGGRDGMSGGDQDDVLAGGSEADLYRCGAGNDEATQVDQGDRVTIDCETIEASLP